MTADIPDTSAERAPSATILPFPVRTAPRLEVWSGTYRGDPTQTYFVSYFNGTGGEFIVFDGATYAGARQAASEWLAGDPAVRVIDRVREAAR